MRSKFLKKLMTGILSVAMMATMIPTALVSAGAATVDKEGTGVPADSSLIDRTQTGTLHITKYEIENITQDVEYNAKHIFDNLSFLGTGEEADASEIPAEAKTFADVKFKIYRIADIDTALLYLEDGKKIPTASDVTETMLANADVVKEGTTGSNGQVTFTGLKLGIYYVEETEHPTQVTQKVAPFTVSLPQTSNDGTKWLYDVYAYPKNETQYANVTMHKMDAVANKGLENVGFTLDESFDNKATWSPVTGGTNNVYYTDANGDFTWEHLPSQRYYRILEVSVPDAKYICNDDEYIVFYINGSGEVELQNQASLHYNIDLQVNDNATNTITMDNDYVTTDKVVIADDGTEGKDKPVNINENVDWKITATVPQEMAKMKKYIITDTMSTGLKYVSSKVVGVDENGSTVVTFEAGTGYTLTGTNSSVVKFSFTSAGCKSAASSGAKTIVISYKTLVTPDAPLGTAMENKSTVTYSNKFATDSSYDVDTPNPPEVHTGGYQLKKVNESNAPLTGVTFKVFATKTDAENLTNALTFYTYDSTGKKVQTTEAVSDANGLVSILGLRYGSFGNKANEGSTKYYVVETSTNDGYNLLKDPFEIVINSTSHAYSTTNRTIVNTEQLVLPPTGVMASVGTVGIGIVLLGIGLIVSMKKKKRKSN